MGIPCLDGKVRDGDGRESTARFLVDGGATYSLLPDPVWRSLGLAQKRDMEFSRADGRVVRRAIS